MRWVSIHIGLVVAERGVDTIVHAVSISPFLLTFLPLSGDIDLNRPF